MPDNDEQKPQLRAELQSPDRHRRAYAAIQLGKLGDRQSIDELRHLSEDADDLVAIAAMYGSWKLGVDAVAIERMVAALESSEEELVQESVFALGDMGTAIVPKLTRLLEEQSQHADSILRILADIGGQASFDTISRYQTDDPELTQTIQELLDDWDDEDEDEKD